MRAVDGDPRSRDRRDAGGGPALPRRVRPPRRGRHHGRHDRGLRLREHVPAAGRGASCGQAAVALLGPVLPGYRPPRSRRRKMFAAEPVRCAGYRWRNPDGSPATCGGWTSSRPRREGRREALLRQGLRPRAVAAGRVTVRRRPHDGPCRPRGRARRLRPHQRHRPSGLVEAGGRGRASRAVLVRSVRGRPPSRSRAPPAIRQLEPRRVSRPPSRDRGSCRRRPWPASGRRPPCGGGAAGMEERGGEPRLAGGVEERPRRPVGSDDEGPGVCPRSRGSPPRTRTRGAALSWSASGRASPPPERRAVRASPGRSARPRPLGASLRDATAGRCRHRAAIPRRAQRNRRLALEPVQSKREHSGSGRHQTSSAAGRRARR